MVLALVGIKLKQNWQKIMGFHNISDFFSYNFQLTIAIYMIHICVYICVQKKEIQAQNEESCCNTRSTTPEFSAILLRTIKPTCITVGKHLKHSYKNNDEAFDPSLL